MRIALSPSAKVGAVVALALMAGLLPTGVALGHAEPERFDPAPGSVLDEVPARVDAWFTQEVRRTDETFLRVLDDGGEVVSQDSVLDDADRRHMYADLQPGLGPGRYLVAYQTFSDEDGEVSGACFLFFVGQEAADRAHEEKKEVSAAEDCPVESEDEEEAAEAAELRQQVDDLQAELAAARDDGGASVGALIGAAIGAAAAGLAAGAGAGVIIGRRRG